MADNLVAKLAGEWTS